MSEIHYRVSEEFVAENKNHLDGLVGGQVSRGANVGFIAALAQRDLAAASPVDPLRYWELLKSFYNSRFQYLRLEDRLYAVERTGRKSAVVKAVFRLKYSQGHCGFEVSRHCLERYCERIIGDRRLLPMSEEEEERLRNIVIADLLQARRATVEEQIELTHLRGLSSGEEHLIFGDRVYAVWRLSKESRVVKSVFLKSMFPKRTADELPSNPGAGANESPKSSRPNGPRRGAELRYRLRASPPKRVTIAPDLFPLLRIIYRMRDSTTLEQRVTRELQTSWPVPEKYFLDFLGKQPEPGVRYWRGSKIFFGIKEGVIVDVVPAITRLKTAQPKTRPSLPR